MDSNEEKIARLVADICGPVIGAYIAEMRSEIRELRTEIQRVRDIDRDEVAGQIAELVDGFATRKFEALDTRIAELEQRWIPRKDWVA